jgi:hypothetical protein
MKQVLSFMDRPRSEFDGVTALLKDSDPLEVFCWAHKLAQLADTVMSAVKDEAVSNAEMFLPDGGEMFGEKITIKRSHSYIFSDDRLEKIIAEIDGYDKKLKALKASRKTREDMLVQDGLASLVETKTTIALSKK